MTDPDIVTRLRTVFVSHHDVELMNREAADEIERLRKERDELRDRLRRSNEALDRLAGYAAPE